MNEVQNVTEHTGFPNPATDSTLASLDIGKLLIKHPASTFFMRIDGNLWNQYGIFHNDIVIIDRSLTPKDRDIVIWWDESNFVIGRHKSTPLDTAIWGVVTSVVHRYRS